MANVKFFTQGNYFYIADKGGGVFRYEQVSAIADVLNNICSSQNVPHGPNDSNRELVDKILEHCGGFGGDPNQARVSVKFGKMINDPIKTYHILRTETGEFYVLSVCCSLPLVSWAMWGGEYYVSDGIIKVAVDAGIKKYVDVYNKCDYNHKKEERQKDGMDANLHAQYNVYDVFCEIYDFINSRK